MNEIFGAGKLYFQDHRCKSCGLEERPKDGKTCNGCGQPMEYKYLGKVTNFSVSTEEPQTIPGPVLCPN